MIMKVVKRRGMLNLIRLVLKICTSHNYGIIINFNIVDDFKRLNV